MRTAAEKKANRKLGFLRLAMVSSVTAVLIALGLGVAYVNVPSAGRPCSVRNATTRDAAGRTMWCNPGGDGGGVVWQYAGILTATRLPGQTYLHRRFTQLDLGEIWERLFSV